jgi:hypothetical protein
MVQLRFVGVSEDGQQLVVAEETGEEHLVAIDDRLRAGVNGHLSRLGQLTMALESRISPREIQERVRAGESAEQVAASAGMPLERVLRFVGPVLREREHVAEQARHARLAGPSGGSGPSVLLADIVARLAARRGVDEADVVWDSARREDHSWVVTVAVGDGETASWALDVLRHQATPVDAAARRASGLADDSITLPDGVGSTEPDDQTPAEQAAVRPFVLRTVTLPPEDEPVEKAGGEPLDRARDAAADEQASAAPDITIASGAPDGDTAPDAPAAPGPRRSKRRARVPKWDDIVFGPKTRE